MHADSPVFVGFDKAARQDGQSCFLCAHTLDAKQDFRKHVSVDGELQLQLLVRLRQKGQRSIESGP
jgi:hypothetical protein